MTFDPNENLATRSLGTLCSRPGRDASVSNGSRKSDSSWRETDSTANRFGFFGGFFYFHGRLDAGFA
jgi:hypothetical protein